MSHGVCGGLGSALRSWFFSSTVGSTDGTQVIYLGTHMPEFVSVRFPRQCHSFRVIFVLGSQLGTLWTILSTCVGILDLRQELVPLHSQRNLVFPMRIQERWVFVVFPAEVEHFCLYFCFWCNSSVEDPSHNSPVHTGSDPHSCPPGASQNQVSYSLSIPLKRGCHMSQFTALNAGHLLILTVEPTTCILLCGEKHCIALVRVSHTL